jgi:adenosylhomocysteine nucleosidase
MYSRREAAVPTPAVLGMVTACAYETALVRHALRLQRRVTTPGGQLWQGRLYGQEVAVLRSGMGPERATRAASWLVQHFSLHSLLSVGFAGGLQEGLGTGAALVPQQIRCWPVPAAAMAPPGDRVLAPDARLAHLAALAAQQAALPLHYGTLLSVATVLPEAAAKAELGQRSGAMAVDMESFSLAHIASAHALPFMVLRTIFDACHDPLSFPVQQLTTVDGVVPPGRVLGYLALHPQTLVHLLPLWKKARRAGHGLTAWLSHFFPLLQREGEGVTGSRGG